jgi:ribosomal protein S18 acetylase RimI-like enzyme
MSSNEATAVTRLRLRDGEMATLREVTEADAAALGGFLEGLCQEARRLRFFCGAVDVGQAACYVAATGPDRIGLLAEGDDGTVLGHATCIELGDGRAEIAVEVADRLHGQGLGTILVEQLAAAAERRGVAHLVAQVLPENRAMLDVLRDGFEAHVTFRDGTDTVEFPSSSWRTARRLGRR